MVNQEKSNANKKLKVVRVLGSNVSLAVLYTVVCILLFASGVVFHFMYFLLSALVAILGIVYAILGIADDAHPSVRLPLSAVCVSLLVLLVSTFMLFGNLQGDNPYEEIPALAYFL